jgi:hypothetical protein
MFNIPSIESRSLAFLKPSFMISFYERADLFPVICRRLLFLNSFHCFVASNTSRCGLERAVMLDVFNDHRIFAARSVGLPRECSEDEWKRFATIV